MDLFCELCVRSASSSSSCLLPLPVFTNFPQLIGPKLSCLRASSSALSLSLSTLVSPRSLPLCRSPLLSLASAPQATLPLHCLRPLKPNWPARAPLPLLAASGQIAHQTLCSAPCFAAPLLCWCVVFQLDDDDSCLWRRATVCGDSLFCGDAFSPTLAYAGLRFSWRACVCVQSVFQWCSCLCL